MNAGDADLASAEPSPAAANGGRSSGGKFGPGNKFGKGNPLARRTQLLRTDLMRSATTSDLREVFAAMVTAAKGGDVQAAKLVFDRVLGPVTPIEVQSRIEELEAQLQHAIEMMRTAVALPAQPELRKAS